VGKTEVANIIGDVTGRLSAYSYLRYALNTQDPERSKFLGDIGQQLTDLSTGLLFWELELNAIDDAVIEATWRAAMSTSAALRASAPLS